MNQISLATGIYIGKEGASLSEIDLVFETLKLKTKRKNVTDNYAKEAAQFLKKDCKSIMGIAFMISNNVKGHALNIKETSSENFILENNDEEHNEAYLTKKYNKGIYLAPLDFQVAKQKEVIKLIENTKSKY